MPVVNRVCTAMLAIPLLTAATNRRAPSRAGS